MSEIYHMAGHLIRRLNQISVSVFQDRMAAAGHTLTSVQFVAMDMLHRHPGIDQATLAGLIAYDRATIGGVVDRLETKGLVRREVSPADRRAKIVWLTDEGLAVLKEIFPIIRDLQPDILTGLTDEERDTFLRLAAKSAAAGNRFSRAPLHVPQGLGRMTDQGAMAGE